MVTYDLVDGEFVLREHKGKIKSGNLRKIFKEITENKQLIIDAWHEYFDGKK